MNSKVIVIGLDGATFDIIDPLIDKGQLPNISKIINKGVKARLMSSVPPISAPAWVSFMTGKNPGKHGILGFQFYNLHKYNCVEHGIISSKSYSHSTIFDLLSKYQKRSVAFQVPLTYPVWPIKGIMVAGYPTPDQTKAFTYPESLSNKIGQLYEYKSDQIAAGSIDEKLSIYTNGLDRVSACVENLLKKEPYDLFVYVNNIPDWVQHKFWKYQFNGHNSENSDYIDQFYRQIDEKVGNILDLADDDTTIFLMSDHGAGARPDKFLNINFLLREKGYLTPTRSKISIITKTNKYWFEWIKEFFPIRYWTQAKFSSKFREMVCNTRVYKNNINWEKTRAYRVPLAYPYVGININLKDRQKYGIVSSGKEFNDLRYELYTYLKEFSDEHPQFIKSVYYQEDIYNGPHTFNTPDIVIEIAHEYDSGPEIDELITEIPKVLLQTISGYHRPHGIFAAMGKNILHSAEVKDFNITDLAPTILYSLDLPIDNNFDGQLLKEIFTDEYVKLHIPQYVDEDNFILAASENDSYITISEQDESEIMASLHEMGYL